MSDPTKARGFRNRNPGNLVHVEANKWQGLDSPPSDGRFCRFTSHQYGIRALAVLLISYQDRYGLRRVRDIIPRYAPASENDTAAYVAAVCRASGFAPDQALDLHRHDDLRPVILGIITHELGGQPYDAATIDQGLTLAGVAPPPGAAVARTGTARAAAGTAAAGIGTLGLMQVVEALAPHAGAIADLARALGPWVTGAALALAAGWFIWSRLRRQQDVAS